MPESYPLLAVIRRVGVVVGHSIGTVTGEIALSLTNLMVALFFAAIGVERENGGTSARHRDRCRGGGASGQEEGCR